LIVLESGYHELFAQVCPQNLILPISASLVARIPGVSYLIL
jgi:hypothetical protein